MDIIKIQSVRRVGLALLCAGVRLGLLLSGGLEVAAQKTITVCAEGCDFAKIQQAIDAAAAGDTIDVKAGTYVENLTIRNKNDLTLQGAGRDQVTLDGNAPNQQNITPGIFITGSRNVTIKRFKITNSRRGLETSNSSLLFIEENAFEKNLRQGINIGSSEARIVGNLIQGTQPDLDGSYGDGIISGSSQIALIDNVVKENIDCGVRTNDNPARLSQLTGSGNTITDNRAGNLCGTVPVALLTQPPVEGTLDQVTVPVDAPTIQEAVNKVKAGGTITVNAGTYQEQVQIYKSLTLRGYGADVTVLQADLTIIKNRITGTRRDAQGSYGRGIHLSQNVRATISENIIADNAFDGVRLFDNVQATITGNTITGSGRHGINIGDYGDVKDEKVRAEISKNEIQDNRGSGGCTDSDKDISITGQGNTITGNAGGNLCGDLSKFPTGFGGGK